MTVKKLKRRNGDIRWAYDGADGVAVLRPEVTLSRLLRRDAPSLADLVDHDEDADSGWVEAAQLAPVDRYTEVWAAGVTYESSRAARMTESDEPDIYDRVYSAARPELFFKSLGWRVRGTKQSITVRADSTWNVPEPELAVVTRADGSVYGYTICNDVSSRSIEGENPLYLPQAKVYLGGCALGPGIVLYDAMPNPYDLKISMRIARGGGEIWSGETSTSGLRRRIEELLGYVFHSDVFPHGLILSTGTSLVPEEPFSLIPGDVVHITIESVGELVNPVADNIAEADPDVPDAARSKQAGASLTGAAGGLRASA